MLFRAVPERRFAGLVMNISEKGADVLAITIEEDLPTSHRPGGDALGHRLEWQRDRLAIHDLLNRLGSDGVPERCNVLVESGEPLRTGCHRPESFDQGPMSRRLS